jgi:hypothetical protein
MVKMYERGMTVEKLTQISQQVFGDACKIGEEESTEATTQQVTTEAETSESTVAQNT